MRATKNLLGVQLRLVVCAAVAVLTLTGCPHGVGHSAPDGQAVAPAIASQPSATTVDAGAAASFTVSATGAGNSYQWQRSPAGVVNWVDITGATAETFALGNVAYADNGVSFRVRVANGGGTVTSSSAALTVRVRFSTNSFDFASGAAADSLLDLSYGRSVEAGPVEVAYPYFGDRATALQARPLANSATLILEPTTRFPVPLTAPVGSGAAMPVTELQPPTFTENSAPASVCAAGFGHGRFCKFNCVEYVYERREQIRLATGRGTATLTGDEIRALGLAGGASAKNWAVAYKNDSRFSTGAAPRAGAIRIITSIKPFGHVQFVEKVWRDLNGHVTGYLVTERNNDKNMVGHLGKRCYGACPDSMIGSAAFSADPTHDLLANSVDNFFVYLDASDLTDFTSSATPVAPNGATATRQSSGTVAFSWSMPPSVTGVGSFSVLRDGALIATVGATNWLDTSLPSSQNACYSVSAKYMDGRSSSATNASCISSSANAVPLARASITATCVGALAAVTWTGGATAERATVLRNGEIVGLFAASAGTAQVAAPSGSAFAVRLTRQSGEATDSNVANLSCAPSTTVAVGIAPLSTLVMEAGERMLSSKGLSPWFATIRNSGAASFAVSTYFSSTGDPYISDLFNTNTAITQASVDENGYYVLSYGGNGVGYLFARAARDTFVAGAGWVENQISGPGAQYPINTLVSANQLAAPWVMLKSPRLNVVAVMNNTSQALDGTTPIWIFKIVDGRAVLTKTIRIASAFVRAAYMGDAFLYVQTGVGLLRRYPLSATDTSFAEVALQQPTGATFGELSCSNDFCVSRVDSTGVLEVTDLNTGAGLVTRFGLLFIDSFATVGRYVLTVRTRSGVCSIAVYERTGGTAVASLDSPCDSGVSIPYQIDRLSVADPWSSSATVMVSTTQLQISGGQLVAPRVLRWRLTGIQ